MEELFAATAPPPLRELRARFDQALLVVLAAAMTAWEPELVVLGGRMSRYFAKDLPQYQEALDSILRVSPVLTTAAFGRYSGVVGAMVLSLQASYIELGIDPAYLNDLPAPGVLTMERLLAVDNSAAWQK
jgi:predicted NBD/HSP70 family sugar kinase